MSIRSTRQTSCTLAHHNFSIQVTFQCKARCPAYDGIQLSGFKFFETDAPLKAQMGSGQLPPGEGVGAGSVKKGVICTGVVGGD